MVSPRVKTAIVGDNVEFKCLFVNLAIWEFINFTNLTNAVTNVYKSHRNASRRIFNYLILKIFNVQPFNAGQYICHHTTMYRVDVLGL